MWLLTILLGISGLAGLRWYADQDERYRYRVLAHTIARGVEEMFYGYLPEWRRSRDIYCRGWCRRRWWIAGKWNIYIETVRVATAEFNVRKRVPEQIKELLKQKCLRGHFGITPIYTTILKEKHHERNTPHHSRRRSS